MIKSQKGQALLIVVLVMVVALTVGLAIASRSIVNLKTSQDQADSQKALAAAQAGVERELVNTSSTAVLPQTFGGTGTNATYTTTITQGKASELFLLNGTFSGVDKNNYVYIWPSKVNGSDTNLYGGNGSGWNGSIDVYWGTDSGNACNNAALEISVISGNYPLNTSKLVLTKYAVDPCNARIIGQTGNGFALVSKLTGNQKTISNKTLWYKTTILSSAPATDSVYLIAITPLYINIAAQADAAHPLPPQGTNITATGNVGGQIKRKVAAFRNLPQIPAELSTYTIFSP
jgi:Tfp pilus assembly protein PilX